MKKVKMVGTRIISTVCTAAVAVSLFFPATNVKASESASLLASEEDSAPAEISALDEVAEAATVSSAKDEVAEAATTSDSGEIVLSDDNLLSDTPEASQVYKDGVYTGVGQGKKGDITLSVTLTGGRVIDLSEVSQSETPYFWEKAKALFDKIKEMQPGADEIDGIDTISGATVSSNGIKQAIKDAYAKAVEISMDDPDEPIVTLSGTGTWSDPYVISNVPELMKFAQNVDEGNNYSGEYVVLSQDIDLSEIENFNSVGTEDGFNIFSGTFDGNGHVISNMAIKVQGASNVGFFTSLNQGAVVKNLDISGSYIEASGDYSLYAGFIAGNIKKTAMIDHCKASGTMSLKSDFATIEAGGIVGNMMLKSTVINSSCDVNICAELSDGIVADIGGIAGLSKMNAAVLNCFSKGSISAQGSSEVHAGGIIGNAMGKTENVVSMAGVNTSGTNASIFGYLDSLGYASNYYSYGTELKMAGNSDENSNSDISLEVLNANISVLHNEYDSYDFYRWIQTDNVFGLSDELWHETEIEASIFDGGDGSFENPYRIANRDQLIAFADSLDTEILYDGKYVELTADIDISDIANWEPIGKSEFAFNGTFNGNGHTVSGLKEGTEKSPRKLSTNYEDFSNALGFFGTLGVDAVVKNLNLTDVAIYSYRDDSSFVGGIVGYMQGLTDESSRKGAIIDNCYVQGTICSTTHEKNAYVGGIAARQYKGAIINCHTDVDLKSTVEYGESIASVGGITGMTNRGLVANCYSTGTYFGSMVRDIENEIEGMSSVGGLVGVDAGDLVNCYISGDTISEHYSIYTGAVTGWVTGIGKAYQCYYDKTKEMTIAGRKEAEVQAYGTKTVGGVNEEGIAYEGGVVDELDSYKKDTYLEIADKLNDNFSSFAIDISKYGVAENALHSWEVVNDKVVLSKDFATAVYVQPEAEKIPIEPLVLKDGTWYGRDNTGKVTVKIVVVDGEVVSTELLTGSKEDTEKYENAIARAQSKAIYGDTTGYGKGDASRFAGGDGTKENPYLIANEEQLRYIAEAINEDETWENKFFKQIADITLSDKDFMPIGFAIKAKINGDPVLYSAYPFRGSYDGADHVIKGLRIGSEDKPASLYTAAMFGFTGGDYDSNILFDDSVLKVELKNIHLEDIFINNVVLYDTYTAGLVGTGQNGVFIDNCSITGEISVKADDIASRGAGLAASMLRGAVTNSWTDVDISAITEDGDVYAGGMFAVTNRINAINCYTLGDVIATANTNNKVHIGGFTGMAGAFQYNCFAMGNVTSDRPSVDIGIMDGRIANIAYDRNCYFNSDAVISENGVVIESVYTGADGTGSSKDVTFGKTKDEFGSQEFIDVLNKNIENVDSELEIADEELGGIMSIYYKDGAPGLMRWKMSDGIPVLAVQKQETAPEEKQETKQETEPEEKPEPKAETKPEEKPEQKAETKPEEKSEPKTENEPIVKTETTQNNTLIFSSGDSNSQNNPSASANETVSSTGNVSASKSNATESINTTNLNGVESTNVPKDNIAAKTQNLESQNLKTDTAETTKTALANAKENAQQDKKINTGDNSKEKVNENVKENEEIKENEADSSAVTEDVGVEITKDDNTIDKQDENKETAVEEKTVSDIPEEDVPLSPGNEKNSSNLPVTVALIIIVAGIVAAGIIMRKKLVIK